MSPVARRLLLYWLLLLLPTLAVAVGAVQLLRRERARLAEQEASAAEARRAAATTRAGLIVENVELLVGDVQAGLLETLAALPARGLEEELVRWERGNPLVRSAFRCAPDGRILHPSAAATDEEARGFRRRFGPLLEGAPPWRSGFSAPVGRSEADSAVALRAFPSAGGAAPAAAEEVAARASEGERYAQRQAESNVAQVQTARRDARAVSKLKDETAGLAAAPAASALGREDVAEKKEGLAEVDAFSRTGWVPWTVDGRLHLLGWVERPGEVRGVELEVAALVARLGGALPAETGAGEGFALRDDRGRILHQAGTVPAATETPTVRVALFSGSLPGWEVVAWLAAPATADGTGSGFFVIGSLLTGILVVAILSGGGLLLLQARRSEAEAAQKTSFVANVSHEFKTPLTTIRLYAELLEQGRVGEPGKQRAYLQTIGRETQRLARLVGNALDFSRLEQGRKKYELAPTDLTAELDRLLDTQAPRLAEAGLALERAWPAEPVRVVTDRDACEQIVLNLLDNAAKYAAGGGEVRVELADRPGGGAVVRVLDRGPGVPPDHRERVFEKFHRVDETLTAEQGGTGLGLSIARQLARGLGGDLRLEPRAGGGACFSLELPGAGAGKREPAA